MVPSGILCNVMTERFGENFHVSPPTEKGIYILGEFPSPNALDCSAVVVGKTK